MEDSTNDIILTNTNVLLTVALFVDTEVWQQTWEW